MTPKKEGGDGTTDLFGPYLRTLLPPTNVDMAILLIGNGVPLTSFVASGRRSLPREIEFLSKTNTPDISLVQGSDCERG